MTSAPLRLTIAQAPTTGPTTLLSEQEHADEVFITSSLHHFITSSLHHFITSQRPQAFLAGSHRDACWTAVEDEACCGGRWRHVEADVICVARSLRGSTAAAPMAVCGDC